MKKIWICCVSQCYKSVFEFHKIQIFSIAKLWLLIAASPLGLSVYGKEHTSKFPSSSGKFVRNLSFFINREKQKNSMAELLKGKRMLWSM